MKYAWIVIAFAACSGGPGGGAVPDAGGGPGVPDARPGGPQPDCVGPYAVLQCQGGTVMTRLFYDRSTSATLACPLKDQSYQASCTGGCAIEGAIAPTSGIDYLVVPDPQALCAQTPSKQVGDACDAEHPCVPTRVTLAADGTVAGQTYLTCSGTCVATAAPSFPWYLTACDADTLATYGVSGANGYAASDHQAACLIAWDDAKQAAASGQSYPCIGDWDCPAGSLCDDKLAQLGAVPVAVCKPGPKGVLTPGMLSP